MGPDDRSSDEPSSAERPSLNAVAGLSWHALKWRWQAFRSGKTFAESVLLNTLDYRVEELFLIHASTGLLLQHVSTNDAQADADSVSAMLTAIRDFVRDSFAPGTDSQDSLDTLRVGDVSVLIEQGPLAILAAVVRGTLPSGGRLKLQDALEAIHRQQGRELETFAGDSAPFARSRAFLESCLISEYRGRVDR